MIQEADLRAMVRLLGDVAALRGLHTEKKRYLLDGLCRLISADAWVWALACGVAADAMPVYVAVMHGGPDDQRSSKPLEARKHPDVARLNAAIIHEFCTTDRHLTRLREQVDVENRFTSCPSYPLWYAAGIGPLIVSINPATEDSKTAIGLYRGTDKPMFTPRELRIAHIILSEVRWLHQQERPEDRASTVPQLSPRQRITLNLLLEGQSRKDIADHLGISINTVAGYVKDLYKHFHVQSHAELMRRFLHGATGDLLKGDDR